MSAILDALRPLGIEHIDMPATPNRVWQAITLAQRQKPRRRRRILARQPGVRAQSPIATAPSVTTEGRITEGHLWAVREGRRRGTAATLFDFCRRLVAACGVTPVGIAAKIRGQQASGNRVLNIRHISAAAGNTTSISRRSASPKPSGSSVAKEKPIPLSGNASVTMPTAISSAK